MNSLTMDPGGSGAIQIADKECGHHHCGTFEHLPLHIRRQARLWANFYYDALRIHINPEKLKYPPVHTGFQRLVMIVGRISRTGAWNLMSSVIPCELPDWDPSKDLVQVEQIPAHGVEASFIRDTTAGDMRTANFSASDKVNLPDVMYFRDYLIYATFFHWLTGGFLDTIDVMTMFRDVEYDKSGVPKGFVPVAHYHDSDGKMKVMAMMNSQNSLNLCARAVNGRAWTDIAV